MADKGLRRGLRKNAAPSGAAIRTCAALKKHSSCRAALAKVARVLSPLSPDYGIGRESELGPIECLAGGGLVSPGLALARRWCWCGSISSPRIPLNRRAAFVGELYILVEEVGGEATHGRHRVGLNSFTRAIGFNVSLEEVVMRRGLSFAHSSIESPRVLRRPVYLSPATAAGVS